MAITTLNNRAINRSDTASADQVWTATSATATDFQGAASAGWTVLQTQEITSATADMEFIDGTGGTVLDATYDNYCLILSKVVPVTDNVELLMTISNDTGSSYITSAYKTQAWVVYSGGTYYYANTTGVTGDSTDWSNDSQGTLRVWFQNPAVNQFFQCYHQGTCTNTPDDNYVAWFGVGTYPTAVAGGYDAFRLAFTSGDIATMKATLFGISQ